MPLPTDKREILCCFDIGKRNLVNLERVPVLVNPVQGKLHAGGILSCSRLLCLAATKLQLDIKTIKC